jgi:tetratricopeptide (TPR) repeat protein
MYLAKCLMTVLVIATAAVFLTGCGSDPGGDFINGSNQANQLPISGPQQKLQEGFGLYKAGSFTQARDVFLKIIGDSPSAADRAQALAGVAFTDVRLKGSQDGIAEFEQALTADSKNQDARVGLAGALISRGAPTDILRSIELIQGIDPGNPDFVYTDKFGTGIKNAEVHALLAYALFVSGDQAGAQTQIAIARRLDPNFTNTNVGQIINVISFIPQ